MSKELKNYIDSLVGRNVPREQIKAKLLEAGWDEKDISKAMEELPMPPAPSGDDMPEPPRPSSHSMVDIFINFFSFILLIIIAISIGTLLFSIIDQYIQDPVFEFGYYYNDNTRSIHYATAALIVSFPLYFWAMWLWLKKFSGADKAESKVSKWTTYFILLVSALVIIGDLISIIFNFLEGELTNRFIFKALSVLVIAGVIFKFYYLERKMIQYKKSVSSWKLKAVISIAIVLVAGSVSAGFVVGTTPGQARLQKIDNARINNVYNLSSAIESFAHQNKRLPVDFQELARSATFGWGVNQITPDELGKIYTYKINSQTGTTGSYELCVFFEAASVNKESSPAAIRPYGGTDWYLHDAGLNCHDYQVSFGVTPADLPTGVPLKY
ncbi:MAG: DUF5671 domain-containing protein [bacterium]|nr:DUF5671 domain-containing protein [bacterium]